jgi:hypothetical protein
MFTILADAEQARDDAQGFAAQADLDAQATAADRVQTGLDAQATAADRVQTGLDAQATAADRVQTGLDVIATGADRIQTGLDVIETTTQAGLAAASAQEAYNVSRSYVNLVLMGL